MLRASNVPGLTLWLMGSRSRWGPRLGLLGVGLWIVYTVWLKQWGLMPGNLICLAVQIRNMILWERE